MFCSKDSKPNPTPVFHVKYIFKNEFIYLSTSCTDSAKFKMYNFDSLSDKNIVTKIIKLSNVFLKFLKNIKLIIRHVFRMDLY